VSKAMEKRKSKGKEERERERGKGREGKGEGKEEDLLRGKVKEKVAFKNKPPFL